MSDDLARRLHDYVNGLFVREDEALAFVREQTALHDLPQINLQPHEARLLQLLVWLCGARKVVEVGTLAGYSAIWMARALPQDGKLITIDNSAKHARIARDHVMRAGLENKITVLQGDGRQILKKLTTDAPYDLLFVDADKVSYPHYLEWAAENLRAGGAILAHNAFWGGGIFAPATADGRGVAEFNQVLANHPRFESTIIEIGDGMAIGVKVH